MRIVLVNWAPIAEGAARGGGVNGYCQALALDLVALGHEVVSLSSGTAFDTGPLPRIEPRGEWRGVGLHEVVNSPVLAPSFHQFAAPEGETRSSTLERAMTDWIRQIAPDAVHFHNLEGFTAGCVAAIRAVDAPPIVLFSIHNYHTICPQVYLMHRNRSPCFDFDNGHRCVGCIEAEDTARERRRRVASGRLMPGGLRSMLKGVPAIRGTVRAIKRAWQGTPDAPAVRAVDHPTWVPLTNSIGPEPESLKPPNAYAQRRAAMIDALNRCDAVLAVSEFVRRKYEALGVSPGVISTMHIGTRMNWLAARHRRVEPPPLSARDGSRRPIRLVFLGYNNYFKGLPMLADALALLTPEVLARFQLTIHAHSAERIEPRFRLIGRRLAGLTIRYSYDFEQIPSLLAAQDLGLVTSVWWDNAPQTVFEMLACGVPVLGAEIGGIPDFIRDGDNGLLFRANDRYDLARRLAQVARDPAVLVRLRQNVRPPKGIDAHAREMAELYQRLRAQAPDQPQVEVRTRAVARETTSL